MALDGCGGVLELVSYSQMLRKVKRVTTTVDLERLVLHWLEAKASVPGQRARSSQGESTESQPLD